MKLKPINLNEIKIEDEFWSKHVSLVKDTVLPYQWDAINDRIPDAEKSHSLENFKIAAKISGGDFYGAVFQDTDVAKWLEAVGFTLAAVKDEELEKTADEVIDIIAQAQCEDGYLNTYFTIKEPEKRWKNLVEGHELYTAGHMMEAAYAYYYGTGKRKLLDVLLKFADLICDTFGNKEGQINGYPGHQEVEVGLIKLYEITKERKYLDQAKYFIDARGVGENYFLKEMRGEDFTYIFPEFRGYDPSYSQSHLPVREQKTAEGHAVRATYMYTAMADLAYEYEDKELMKACETLWDNIVTKRMYLTGGIGSSGILERFTTDYDLPNDCNYAESCASIGLAMFGQRMGNITRDAKYFDIVEKAVYNTVLSGIALDGKSFFYVNPLEVWPQNCLPNTSKEHVKPVRQKWFGVACCPPNIARTLASLGQYIYSVDETSVYVNLFVSNDVTCNIKGYPVQIKIQTKFPWENTISIQCHGVPKEGMKLAMRIPEYAKDFKVFQNGMDVVYEKEKGYAVLWINADANVTVVFEAPAKFIRSNPRVHADCGKVALMRGPIVYCLEGVDNEKNLSGIYVDTREHILEEKEPLFGGIVSLIVKGKKLSESLWKDSELYGEHPVDFLDITLKAIPYAYWCNRGETEMLVWMKEWF